MLQASCYRHTGVTDIMLQTHGCYRHYVTDTPMLQASCYRHTGVTDIMLQTHGCYRHYVTDTPALQTLCYRHTNVTDIMLQTHGCYRHYVTDTPMLQASCYRHTGVTDIMLQTHQCYRHYVTDTPAIYRHDVRHISVTGWPSLHIHCNTQTLVLHSCHVNMHYYVRDIPVFKFKLHLDIGLEKRQFSVVTSKGAVSSIYSISNLVLKWINILNRLVLIILTTLVRYKRRTFNKSCCSSK